MNARDELRRYVKLLADSWTPRETTDERVERLYAKVRAEVLREAADELWALANRTTERGSGVLWAADKLRSKADEATTGGAS